MIEEPTLINDDTEIVPIDQQESEEDVSPTAETISQAVLFNTDWTVETIIRQIGKGNINLDPKFQRREAWDIGRKSKLIESVMCGFPIPNIVLAEDSSKKGKYMVIDGKQRLFSMISFFNNEFSLKSLIVRKDLNGYFHKDILEKESDLIDFIENQPIRTVIIRNWPNEDYLYSVFYRLNSGSLPLSSQELRKALHGGRLLDHIDDYIRDSKPFTTIFGNKPDRRMRDVELVLRYVSFERFYDTYSGNLKKFLDTSLIFYDTNWNNEKATLDIHLTRLDVALSNAYEIFGDDVFKKWNGTAFERRINRAVFDVITRFFAEFDIATLIIPKKNEIHDCFKITCLNEEFRDAIEKTTKTPKAVYLRHAIWGNALAKLIGKQLDDTSMRLL